MQQPLTPVALIQSKPQHSLMLLLKKPSLSHRADRQNLSYYDPDMEYTTLPNGVTRITPKVPPYQISDKELTAALFEIPYGMVVRENDLLERFQKKHNVRFASIDYSAYWRNWNRWDIPYWRVVSSNGRANGLLVQQDEQILKLKEEGLAVERVYNSFKVVDWKNHLYQFGSDEDERLDI